MDRRTFVASGASFCLCLQLSGCLGDGTDESDDGEEREQSPLRDRIVNGEHLLIERDGLVTEAGDVFVSVSIKNTTQSPRRADIGLQMRDEDGAPVGSEYTTSEGPIDPQETVTVRIDIDEGPDAVGGYRLEVTEREP